MIYTYDFGDDWFHEVTLEDVIDSNRSGSVVCAAKGKCPPDDCCGPFGYGLLKKSLREPDVEPGDIVGTVDFDKFMY